MNQLTPRNLPNNSSNPLRNSQASKDAQVYRTARQHIKNGEWEAGLIIISTLLESYPDVQELKNMHKELLRRVHQMDSSSYVKDPLYRAARRHETNKKWGPALILTDRLMKKYPHVAELLALQTDLQLRVRQQKQAQLRENQA